MFPQCSSTRGQISNSDFIYLCVSFYFFMRQVACTTVEQLNSISIIINCDCGGRLVWPVSGDLMGFAAAASWGLVRLGAAPQRRMAASLKSSCRINWTRLGIKEPVWSLISNSWRLSTEERGAKTGAAFPLLPLFDLWMNPSPPCNYYCYYC